MKYPVLLPNIFDHPFTYKSELKLKVGDYVKVYFGKKLITGVIWDQFEKNNSKNFQINEIEKKLNINSLNRRTIDFLNWFSKYNLIPLGMALKLHLLSGNAVERQNKNEYQKYQVIDEKEQFNLSKEQENALKEIITNINSFRVHLLQGTTGSGKTIVYFNVIKKIIEKKNSV